MSAINIRHPAGCNRIDCQHRWDRLGDAEADLRTLRAELAESRERILDLEGRLIILLERHGDEACRVENDVCTTHRWEVPCGVGAARAALAKA